MPDVRVGISGWTYPRWRGTFYPKGLAQKRELAHASRRMNSIEINGSFYSLQRPTSYQAWHEQTPDDFVFAVKGGRFITHMLKLRNVEAATANFFASGVLALKEKLGPILWQFPPQLGFDEERFDSFLKLLPRNTEAAAEIAKRHNEKLNGRAYTRTDKKRKLRYAFEVRHPSFVCGEFIGLLRRHNAALCVADTAQRFVFGEDVTADFVYVRLHGSKELYASGYDDQELDWWAGKCHAWMKGDEPADAVHFSIKPPKPAPKRGRDVYVYFDNDAKVHAPFDAIRLAERLGVTPLS
jgi:uncharacterized protein YecE (DUF72 family)